MRVLSMHERLYWVMDIYPVLLRIYISARIGAQYQHNHTQPTAAALSRSFDGRAQAKHTLVYRKKKGKRKRNERAHTQTHTHNRHILAVLIINEAD